MELIKSGAIIDDNSNIIEIAEGRNTAIDDGYLYMTDNKEDDTVFRVGASGFVDGEFTLHKTRADVEMAIGQPRL